MITDLDSFFTENGLYQEGDVDIVTAEAIKDVLMQWLQAEGKRPRGISDANVQQFNAFKA